MNDAIVPSYRVPRPESGVPWRMLAVAGGLLGAVAVGAGGFYAWQSLTGPRTIPVVEADPRPFKVRPDDPGGLRVPNQDELILERPSARPHGAAPARPAIAPVAEAPDISRLRAAVATPMPAPAPAPMPAAPALTPAIAPLPAAPAVLPQEVTRPAAPPAAQAPQPEATPAAAPAAPRPAGRAVVQLGALGSEEAARAEWERLTRRAPELFQGRNPQIIRLEREGQAPLFRLRTGGLADQDAAAQFCEQVRSRGGACMPVRL